MDAECVHYAEISRNCLAPVVLFVYNRPSHTADVVEALQKNTLARKSVLYVYSDGARSDKDKEHVEQVRSIVDRIDGFASVHVVRRETNYGLARSIVSGVHEVIARHGSIIVLEDDLVTSPYFLSFMNDALDFYQGDTRVVSIHGYMYPVSGCLPETFFLKDTGSWGWATWQRGWDLFEPDGSKLLGEIRRRNLTHTFDMEGAYPFTRMLADQVEGRNDSWAIRWQASAFLKSGLTLFPGRSLVNNIGHDSSGSHCGTTPLFEVPPAQDPVQVAEIPVEENSAAKELLKEFFRRSGPGWFVRLCMGLRRMMQCLW